MRGNEYQWSERDRMARLGSMQRKNISERDLCSIGHIVRTKGSLQLRCPCRMYVSLISACMRAWPSSCNTGRAWPSIQAQYIDYRPTRGSLRCSVILACLLVGCVQSRITHWASGATAQLGPATLGGTKRASIIINVCVVRPTKTGKKSYNMYNV